MDTQLKYLNIWRPFCGCFLRLQMDDFYRRDKHVVGMQTEEEDIGFFSSIKKRYIVLDISF